MYIKKSKEKKKKEDFELMRTKTFEREKKRRPIEL